MGRVINVKPQPLYPRKWPGTHFTGGWVGHRVGLDECGNPVPIGIWTPYRPASSESYPAHIWPASGILQVFRQTERLTWLGVTVKFSHRGQSSDLCDEERPDNGTWRQQWPLYKYTMMYQSNTTKLYYVYYCIRATCFDSYRIIFRPF